MAQITLKTCFAASIIQDVPYIDVWAEMICKNAQNIRNLEQNVLSI